MKNCATLQLLGRVISCVRAANPESTTTERVVRSTCLHPALQMTTGFISSFGCPRTAPP